MVGMNCRKNYFRDFILIFFFIPSLMANEGNCKADSLWINNVDEHDCSPPVSVTKTYLSVIFMVDVKGYFLSSEIS